MSKGCIIDSAKHLLEGDFASIDAAKERGISAIRLLVVNSNFVEQILKEIQPDIVISCYFDQLIRKNIFDIPKIETINFHSGSLPTYRGPFPTFWALLHGQKKFSIHAHVVEEKFDTGPTF